MPAHARLGQSCQFNVGETIGADSDFCWDVYIKDQPRFVLGPFLCIERNPCTPVADSALDTLNISAPNNNRAFSNVGHLRDSQSHIAVDRGPVEETFVIQAQPQEPRSQSCFHPGSDARPLGGSSAWSKCAPPQLPQLPIRAVLKECTCLRL